MQGPDFSLSLIKSKLFQVLRFAFVLLQCGCQAVKIIVFTIADTSSQVKLEIVSTPASNCTASFATASAVSFTFISIECRDFFWIRYRYT